MICIEIMESLLKRELAIHLVRERRCTVAQAAHLAAMPRLIFERLLGERKIPWAGNIDEIKKDLKALESS